MFTFLNWQYTFKKNFLLLEFKFQLNDLKFSETLALPRPQSLVDLNQRSLNQAINLLHLMLGVSYYKTYVPEEISLNQKIDSETADFFNQTYFKGLQEFAYVNKLDLKNKIKFPASQTELKSVSDIELKDEIILPIGGGKDSLLALEILKDKNPLLLTLGKNPVAKEIADLYNLELIEIERKIDPLLLELNKQGAYNGHVPFSAILGFILAFSTLLYRKKFLVLANEASANEANTTYLGEAVNHQYSKSFEFELAFNKLVKSKIHPEIEYFSLLRQFSEVKIAKEFSKHDHLLSIFSSCNNIKKTGYKKKWCAKCSKCCFVFLMLAAFLPEEKVVRIFGSNLFADPELKDIFYSLCGISGIKPLECVGEFKESAALVSEIHRQGKFKNSVTLNTLVKEIKTEYKVDDFLERLDYHNIPACFMKLSF